jgi:hypothetical protein
VLVLISSSTKILADFVLPAILDNLKHHSDIPMNKGFLTPPL